MFRRHDEMKRGRGLINRDIITAASDERMIVMRAIMVMFDSLNRHMLSTYGCDWTHTPNFKRLAEHSVVFDRSYIGSYPCMPARRELQTGRYNFLHRSWGPMEPFDDSMPEILSRNGIYTHLVSDHQHYWEDGGCTYHHRYNTWEIVRGQEGDRWKGVVDASTVENVQGSGGFANGMRIQDAINRSYNDTEEKMCQSQTFKLGLEFMERNVDADNWFLQLETFDPHEPFYSTEEYKQFYPHDYDGPMFDWPPYGPVTEPRDMVEHCRLEYAALLTMCDTKLGMVLDFMDAHHMWDDTLLIVNTDHGFMLGEHDVWAKGSHPMYNEVVHTPLFVWDPRFGIKGERRSELVQTVDLCPTVLEFFGIERTRDMTGRPLRAVIEKDESIHDGVLFGSHGGILHCTDGRYVYMRDFDHESGNKPLYEYTLMPTHMRSMFSPQELENIEISEPLSFTKGAKVMKIPSMGNMAGMPMWRPVDPNAPKPDYSKLLRMMQQQMKGDRTVLFDLEADPGQLHPCEDPEAEEYMIRLMVRLMKEADAPAEQYERLRLQDYV